VLSRAVERQPDGEVMMSILTGPLTYEDLCRQREDGNRYELIDGVLIVIAGPSPMHQWVSHRLAVAFDRAVVEPGLGFIFAAPLDVQLGPQTYVQPDLLVVLRERAGIIGATLIEGAPDLVVEIISASSRAIDRTRKLTLYARSGVREYWLVDLEARSVTVHAEPVGDRFARVERADQTARSVILPGLAVDLDALFSPL
jgi:Uma2 family endonuclease